MSVEIKSPREIEGLRVACEMASETLLLVGERIRAGMTTEDINTLVHEDTIRRGAYPAPLNAYPHGFPKSVCTSVNEVVCHGIPGPQVLKDGDIINVDVTTMYKGFYGDTSATFYIGIAEPKKARPWSWRLHGRRSRSGSPRSRTAPGWGTSAGRSRSTSRATGVQRRRGTSWGHGIGRKFHEPPQVKHYGKRGSGERLKAGMVFTIEPMVNIGRFEVEVDPMDKWTVTTARRLPLRAVRAHRRRHPNRERGPQRGEEKPPE